MDNKLEGLEFLKAKEIRDKPCDLKRPFAFISYSHDEIDVTIVRNVFTKLYDDGYNLWIDTANIPIDENSWRDAATDALTAETCALALFFRSEPAVISHNIMVELEMIKDLKNIKRIATVDIWHEENNDAVAYRTKILNEKTNEEQRREKLKKISVLQSIYSIVSKDASAIRLKDLEESSVDSLCDKIKDQLEESNIFPKKASSIEQSNKINTQPPANSEEKKATSQEKIKPQETSVDGQKRISTTTGDITYTIYGKEYTDNQANMMLNVFAKVLQKHPDAVGKILADPEKPLIRCVSSINYELPENKTVSTPTRYNAGCYFPIGQGIFVGTALNYPEKLRNIAQLLTICGEDFSILQSEQIELPSSVKTRSSGSNGDEVYTIYGEEHSGNQTQMMVDTLKFIMEKHFDKREELAKLSSIKLSPMSSLTDSTYFRTGNEFSYQGVTYSIGTSFSRQDKLKQILKAINICGEDIGQFKIDGLDDAKPAKRSSTQKRNFLED